MSSAPAPRRLLHRLGQALGALIVLLALVAVALAWRGGRRMAGLDTPSPDLVASSDTAVIARGRALVYGAAHCAQCHGAYDRMHPEGNTDGVALSGGMTFPMGPLGTAVAANLTSDAATGLGARSDAELARAIATGVTHDGRLSILMRVSGANLSREDLVAVISFLRTVPPVRQAHANGPLPWMGHAIMGALALAPDTAPLPAHVAPSDTPTVARGEYLARHVALCVTCHSRYDARTFAPVEPLAAGSAPEPSHGNDADMEFVAPNLTRDPTTGLTGRLDEEAFVARMRRGRVHASSLMPWENLARVPEPDLRAIYRYLRTLPPVVRDVGPTYRRQGSHAAS